MTVVSNKAVTLWIVGLLLAMAVQPALATDYSGTCTGTVPAGSHQLVGNCTVPLGQTWTLEPGAILAGNGWNLFVNGTLDMDQADITQAFISFNPDSGGTITATTFDNTSSTSACLININDASPSFTGSNNFSSGTGSTRWICITGSSVVDPAAPVISGNSFGVNYTGGGIDVGGTAQPAISNNSFNIVGGVGVSFEDSSSGTLTGNTLGFQAESASNRTAIWVFDDASPSVTGNTVTDDVTRNDFGLVLQFSSASSAQVTTNTVNCSSGDVPLRLGTGAFGNAFAGDVSGNTYNCPGGVTEIAGTVDADSTIATIDGISSFSQWTTITVPFGLSLSVSAGVSMDGRGNSMTINGTLNIDQASITQAFINYNSGSGGSITASTFDNTSSSSGCLINITDSSPTITGSNNFLAGVGSTRWICIGGSSIATPAQPVISGNSLAVNYSGGGIDAGGTSQPAISNNSIQIVGGVGASFEDSSSGSFTSNTLTFQLDTASNRSAIYVFDDASPSVTLNTIVDDTTRSDFGLNLQFSTASVAQVTGNTVGCSGDDVPLLFAMGVFGDSFGGDVSGNIYSCAVNGVAQVGGTLTGDSTMGVVDGVSSYDLWTTLTVPAGRTLSIPAGIALDGRGNALFNSGTLIIDQASITQTFIDYQAGSTGSITASTFDNTTSSSGCLIDIVDASPTISGNNSFLPGVGVTRWICIGGSSIVTPAAPLITNNSFFVNYSGGGIDVYGTAEPTISSNTVEIIGGVGVSFEDTSSGLLTDNDFTFATDTASGRSAIYLFDDASTTVTLNTVVDDVSRDDFGLNLQFSSNSTAQVTGNTIGCSGGDVPLLTTMGVFGNGFAGDVSGNTYGCTVDGVAQIAGTLDSDATLATLDGASNFDLWTTLTVPAGRVLSIPAGIGIDGRGNTMTVNGTLNIDQASITQVFINFTSSSAGSITASTFDNTTSSSGCLINITDSSPSITGANVFLPGVGVSRWICVGGNTQPSQATPTISANTLNTNYSGGGIDVGGTSNPTITGNTINVFGGVGMSFEDTSTGTATGNTIVFEPSANSGRTALYVFDDASVNASSNSIVDDASRSDTGLLLTMTAASTATVTANNVGCSGDDTPLSLGPGPLGDGFGGTVTGNTFSCLQNRVVFGGTVSDDTTLGLFDGLSQFQLSTTLTVSAGITLTIPTGISIFGVNNTLTVNGNANVSGTLDNVFVQVNAGGNFSADGMTKINSNDWINYDAGSAGTIVDSTITGTSGTGVFIADADVTISGTTFSGWATAVRLDGTAGTGTIVLDANTFVSNGIGIDIDSALTTSTASNNVFDRNTYSLDFDVDTAAYSAYPAGFNSSSFSGGPAFNLLRLPTTFNDSGILPVPPAPFYTSGLTVSGGAQVTVFGGTVFAAGNFTQIIVNADSRLVANGSELFPVVFTDFNRDDGSGWSGLVIRSDDSQLQNCVVEFSRVDGLRLESASVDVTNCRISDNLGDGVELTGDSSPTISGGSMTGNIGDGVRANLTGLPVPGPIAVTGLSIFSNGGQGINNLGSTFNIEAMLNYWGDDSGPFDGSDDTGVGGLFNPTGLGQAVSDNVLYDPWIILGPSQEGVIIPVSGDGQVGVVGQTLPIPLTVRIESLLGTPLEGIEVIFSVASGDATIVEAQPVLTAANGEAQATVQLGLTEGEVLFAVTARDVNSPLATFMGEANNPCLVRLQVLPVDLHLGAREQRGDVNGDGLVNVQDAALISAVIDGVLSPKSDFVPTWARNGDVNGDGAIDSGDVLVVQGVQIGQIGQ